MDFKKGFTLAEVLITLVIIGVIAAMTIPTLINKTNEQETVTAVKKAYSVLGQAYQKVIAENGEIIPSTLGENAVDAAKTIGEMLSKQINTQEICGMATDGNCIPESGYKYFNGSNTKYYHNSARHFKMVSSDGMPFAFSASNSYVSRGDSEHLNHIITYAVVDINGDKGPNTIGKDLFAFYITKYGVVPQGIYGDTSQPLSTCRSTGFACTAWVIKNGNMDYLRKDVSW